MNIIIVNNNILYVYYTVSRLTHARRMGDADNTIKRLIPAVLLFLIILRSGLLLGIFVVFIFSFRSFGIQ